MGFSPTHIATAPVPRRSKRPSEPLLYTYLRAQRWKFSCTTIDCVHAKQPLQNGRLDSKDYHDGIRLICKSMLLIGTHESISFVATALPASAAERTADSLRAELHCTQ